MFFEFNMLVSAKKILYLKVKRAIGWINKGRRYEKHYLRIKKNVLTYDAILV